MPRGARRVQAALAGSPSVAGVTSPPEGENPRGREPLPSGEVPGRAEREPTRTHGVVVHVEVQDAFRLRSPVPPLSLERHLPRWGRIRVRANLSLQGEVPGRAEREPARTHRCCLRCGARRVQAALAGSPSVTGVTSPPEVLCRVGLRHVHQRRILSSGVVSHRKEHR